MGRAGVAVRAPSPRGLAWHVPTLALTAVLAGLTAMAAVAASGAGLRLLCACIVGFTLVTLSLTRPAAGVVATFGYLVVLAFVRRLLIAKAPWLSTDPLLLVGPLVASVLLIKVFVLDRRPVAGDWLSKLVLALFLLTVAQAANPNAGIAAGITGLLFMAVPLLWFFVGREILTDRAAERVLQLVVVLGTPVAAYGLLQTELGHPPWDQEWLAYATHYTSLNVGDQIRAFGTFSSFGEYATFTSATLVVAMAFVLRGKAIALLPLPLLAVALFLASSRTALLTAVLATVVMIALRPRRAGSAALIIVIAVGLAVGGMLVFGSHLSRGAESQDSLVSHQLGGLTDPLNPESSTLIVHVEMVRDGITTSLQNPLGLGTGSANLASGISANRDNPGSTDIDISNEFVALGPVGGVLYVALIVLAFALAVGTYFRGNDLALPVVGVLIVGFGQWLNGGFYALSPLVWLLVGWLAAAWVRSGRARPVEAIT